MGLNLGFIRFLAGLSSALVLPAYAAGTADQEVKLLRAHANAEARRVLARYDAHLLEHPDDAAMAIERCEFSWYAEQEFGLSEELEDAEFDEESTDCGVELKERFPKEPVVLLFVLSNSWGEKGVALAESILDDTSVRWPDASKAKVYENLAWKQWDLGKFPEASRAAREATKLDISLELSLPLARGLMLEEKREKAIEVLTAGLDHSQQRRVHAKAELLLELGACEIAARLFERPELAHQTILHARVLECQGETEAAREKYSQIDAEHWQWQKTTLRLFELDLRGGDEARAVASYQALRDIGWRADPFGRHRLALARRCPLSRWEPRDALGFLALGGLMLALVLVPGLWLVPVHYVGLLRRTHRGLSLDPSDRWKLRHVWMASAALFLVDAAAMFFFLEGELEAIWVNESDVPVQHSLEALGRYGLVFFVTLALAVLAMLRPRDLTSLARSKWHPAVGIVAAGMLAGFFFVTLFVYAFSARAIGVWDFPAAALFELDRMNVFRGMRASFGIVSFFAVSVLVVPVYEEILFRWITLDGLSRHVPFWAANILQSLLFASLHMSWVLLPFFFGFAFVLGYVRRFSGSVLVGILAHATYNALVMLLWVLFKKV